MSQLPPPFDLINLVARWSESLRTPQQEEVLDEDLLLLPHYVRCADGTIASLPTNVANAVRVAGLQGSTEDWKRLGRLLALLDKMEQESRS